MLAYAGMLTDGPEYTGGGGDRARASVGAGDLQLGTPCEHALAYLQVLDHPPAPSIYIYICIYIYMYACICVSAGVGRVCWRMLTYADVC